MLAGSYSATLVVCSLIVAMLASYTALTMAGRVSSTKGSASMLWLVGGSFAMGFGIWSMHFIGMLAFRLPIAVGYDLDLTLASLAIAVTSSAFALWLVCQKELPVVRLAMGAVLMGIGIAAMHYTGMAAMRMEPGVIYDPPLFAASVLIAMAASGAALWIAFRLRSDRENVLLARLGASVIMGCAIVGMHYTGMAATDFPVGSYCGAVNSAVDARWLTIVVIGVSLAVFSIALIVAMLDVRADALSSSLDRANSELVQLALHDTLTRLPNRVLLGDRLSQAVHKATREERQFAVLFIDLDGFKAVNDVFGHHVGDLLLQEVAARILVTRRDEDTVARLGGDEFVMVFDVNRPEDAAVLAQRLVDSLAAVYHLGSHTVHVAASGIDGHARCRDEPGDSQPCR